MLRLIVFCFSTLALQVSASLAFPHPDIRQMTCAEVQALVQREKAIVLTFTRYTYDRVVTDRWQCDRAYSIAPIYKATKDQARCNLGYICVAGSERENWPDHH